MSRYRIVENAPEDRALYTRKLQRVLRQVDDLDAEAIRLAREFIADLADKMLGRLQRELAKTGAVDNPRWATVWLPQLQAALRQAAEQLAQQFGLDVEDLLPDAYRGGVSIADSGLDALAQTSGVAMPLPIISPEQIAIASRFSADLITGLTDEAAKRVGGFVAERMLLGDTPHQVMQALAQDADLDRTNPFKSIEHRAETIARTEMARVQNLGNEKRMQQAVSRHPDIGLQMQMIVAVSRRRGTPCETCMRMFKSAPNGDGVWEVNDPARPTLPNHPNCLCRFRPYIVGLTSRSDSERKLSGDLADALDE